MSIILYVVSNNFIRMDDLLQEPDNQQKKGSGWRRTIQYWILTWKRFINLRIDHDHLETVKRIEKDIEFSGANVWILFFAIIIASVGLNINSTAVIIGAMLISPLMGPIMGIGLSVGINDGYLLRKSLKNFFIMVLISLIASTLYFLISPLSDAQSELLARVRPSIFDVFIAFFGGMVGMIGNSRKGEKITLISGVAIATALMPPLCTAGYGLAYGNMSYFFGAFYLFFINSFFIALATALIAIYLKIPKRSFIDAHTTKNVKRFVTIFTIIVCIPSIFIAISMIQESHFHTNAIKFIQGIEKNTAMNNIQILKTDHKYDRKGSTISLTLVGESLTDSQKKHMEQEMVEYGLKNTKLILHQPFEHDIQLSGEFTEDLYHHNLELSAQIDEYKEEIARLQQSMINNEQLAKELAIQFPDMETFAISRAIYTNTATLHTDTIPTICVTWNKMPSANTTEKLQQILMVRLNLDQLKIINQKKEEITKD